MTIAANRENPKNPLAFPGGSFPEHPHTPNGMSLRDYFAGQALMGILTKERPVPPDYASKEAYQHADAMLAARSHSTKDAA